MAAIIAGGGKIIAGEGKKSGSSFSARGMPTISPTANSHQADLDLVWLRRPAHKMPGKAELFRQTGFSSFAKLDFLRRGISTLPLLNPRPSKVLELKRASANFWRKKFFRETDQGFIIFLRFHATEYLFWCNLPIFNCNLLKI